MYQHAGGVRLSCYGIERLLDGVLADPADAELLAQVGGRLQTPRPT
tara:strand:+ start:340 stop:477 length:138 start_codon:yes stop_codon:yes gene_type:complete